jgi:hypothetical protein
MAIGVLIGIGRVAWSGVKTLKYYVGDRRDLRAMKKKFRPERRSIAENFLKLRSGWGRLTYVALLEDFSLDHIETLKRPENVWPEGCRPQLGDAASERLARLDARWLGLD